MGSLEAKKTLINDKRRLLKYFPAEVQREVARNTRNPESQRDILLNHVQNNYPDLARLFNDHYYSEIDEIIEFVERKYPSETNEAMDKKMGISKVKGETPKKKKVFVKTETAKPKQRKTLKVKRGKKIYTRQKGVKIEKKKVLKTFIKVRVDQGMTQKEITKQYNAYAKSEGLESRTNSSLTNFRYRNGIKKK
jgi:hypothetical protein